MPGEIFRESPEVEWQVPKIDREHQGRLLTERAVRWAQVPGKVGKCDKGIHVKGCREHDGPHDAQGSPDADFPPVRDESGVREKYGNCIEEWHGMGIQVQPE